MALPFRNLVHNSDANFIEVGQQVGRVQIDAIGANLLQFFLPISPRKQSDSQAAGSARGQQVPNAISDNHRSRNRHVQSLRRSKKQIWVWLCALDFLPCDDRNLRPYSQFLQG